jgi:DNA-binding MarR family transcriptional regulator
MLVDSDVPGTADARRRLNHVVGMHLPVLTSEADWTTRAFAERAGLSPNEFHALVFVALARMESKTMTAGALRAQMGLSAAAITYLVQRLVEAGHLLRDLDPRDRRKVILTHTETGRQLVGSFFDGVARHNHRALADLPDADLEGAHRAFQVMIQSMKDFRARGT